MICSVIDLRPLCYAKLGQAVGVSHGLTAHEQETH